MNILRNVLVFTVALGFTFELKAEIISGIEYATTESGAKGNRVDKGKDLPKTMDVAAPPFGAVVIDFDDVVAPCSWSEIPGPLSDEYASQGVTFSGPSQTDGAGLINECGNFPVDGHSSPNFMATNSSGTYGGGGTPTGPETMTFNPAVSHVQINASAAAITMECFSGANSVGSASITQSTTVQTLLVSAATIDRCELSWSDQVAVFDDLAFVQGEVRPPLVRDAYPVPVDSKWGLMILTVTFLLFGGSLIRRMH